MNNTTRLLLASLLLIPCLASVQAHSEISGTVRSDEQTESSKNAAGREREEIEHNELVTAKNTNRNTPAVSQTEKPVNADANLNYDELKTKISNRVDTAGKKIDEAIQKISKSSYLSATTKTTLTSSLENLKNGLEKYQSKLATTGSLADLKKLNEEVAGYLKTNKDTIKTGITAAITTIAQEASDKSEQIQKKIDQALKVLTVTCPSQKDTISTLESMLESLNQETEELRENIKKQDKQAITESLQELAELSRAIYEKIVEIQSACAQK